LHGQEPAARSAPDIPRFAAESDEWPFWPRGDTDAEPASPGDLAQACSTRSNSPTWARAKRLLLVMLGLWMSYFPAGELVRALAQQDRRSGVGIPLGTYLAVQGAAIVFAVALFRFARSAD
jgi:putative solute:sodium symporter small subunit